VTAPKDEPGNRSGEDAVWHEIVANYGDRPVFDTEPAEPPAVHLPDDAADPEEPPELDEARGVEERFVPPPPPPLPRVPQDRLAAWLGVLVSPVLLLMAAIFRVSLPTFAAWLLVGAFLGGFGYLVAQMPRGPRDPFDDGAVL
jgi:hypothetical protein